MLSFEGRIRDLALADVFQLLARSRKSGVLECEAPLLSRHARIGFRDGAIVDAEVAAPDSPDAPPPGPATGASPYLEEAALDVLGWTDGRFRFRPEARPVERGTLAVEPLLIEAAQRALVWERIRSRVPHGRVIPAFADLDPGHLPALRLAPPQWDLLAHIDGERDLRLLAARLERPVTAVAEMVHGLVAIGLLTVQEAPVAPRCNPTPPVNVALPPIDDLWIPDREAGGDLRRPAATEPAGDSLFDPVQVGVLTPEGLPALTLPAEPRGRPTGSAGDGRQAVAQPAPGPSLAGEPAANADPVTGAPLTGRVWCREGDDRVRHGDLMGAVACWESAIGAGLSAEAATRVRERIVLATRLHALVSTGRPTPAFPRSDWRTDDAT